MIMDYKEKQLLLKDLCARLPYGVKYQTYLGDVFTLKDITLSRTTTRYYIDDNAFSLNQIKPYLRPMSSMTEEEREELSDYLCEKVMSNKIGITIPPNPTQGKGIPFAWMCDCMEWLNEHHFDYRGLIPMGLALEAPEGMYNK